LLGSPWAGLGPRRAALAPPQLVHRATWNRPQPLRYMASKRMRSSSGSHSLARKLYGRSTPPLSAVNTQRTPVEHYAGVPLRRVSSKHKAGSRRSFHHEVRKLDGRGSQAYRHGSFQEV
jgi:hypothetical protein